MVAGLKVKIYADGADLDKILELSKESWVQGLTTNPTLMRMSGVTDYKAFAKEVLEKVTHLPVSFEVFADDLDGMRSQGREIASWGPNVNVKIPVTNTKGEFTGPVIKDLSAEGIQLNVTAVFSLAQVKDIADSLNPEVFSIVSVFAGRLADTGVDPIPHMREAKELLKDLPKAELLWASPRELLNLFHADEAGCDIITVTPGILSKLKLVGKSAEEYSLETVKMFYTDAQAAGYEIEIN